MKATLLCFLVVTAYTAYAVPLNSDLADENRVYPRYIEFPDGEGVMHTVDLEAEPDLELLNEVSTNSAYNKYLLFTRRNRDTPQSLEINNVASIVLSHFNPKYPTVVIAHGWLSNQDTGFNAVIRDAFLEKGETNVIILDWRRVAMANYVSSVRGVPDVGRGLGRFLAFLNRFTGAPFSSMHLIGFSLGAHVVGNAGKELGGKIARVTALDPAGPLWNLNSNRVSADDAVYVEAIHTDGSYDGLGIGFSVADADFYVNGGTSQPGCLTLVCNHNRAWRFFAATVTYNHLVGKKCDNILQIQLNRCRGEELPLGNDDLKKSGSGRYRVNTRRRYPY